MALDRQKTQEIVQALLRAKNRTDGGNILDNVTQTRAEAGHGSYDEPTFGGRGIPAHGLLGFKKTPIALSRPANPQTMHGRQLAFNPGVADQQRNLEALWERLFPSYCPPTGDNLTFPPLIYQDKQPLTEADKEACHDQFDHDEEQCYKNYSYNPDALSGCYDRAKTIRDLCLRGEKEILPWNDVDQDGVRFNKPGKGRKKK